MKPDGWEEKCLDEIVDLKMGGTPARDEPRYWDPAKSTENRWVAISDIKRRFLVDTSERISNAGVEKSPVKLIEAGTPLMSFKLSIGKATIPLVPVYTNEAIVALDPIGPADKTFLYYAVPPAAMNTTASVAVKGKTLNKGKLREIPILLPPLAEQRKIAAILSSVDEVIEKTEAVIEQLQVVKKAMMEELLTRGIPGRHTRFKQTEIGEIPEEWEVAELGDAVRLEWGNTSITKASYVDNGNVAFSASGPDGFLPDFEHDEPGIILSAIGARCGRCFWAEGKWTAIKNTITATEPSDGIDLRFVFYSVNRDEVWPISGGAQPFIGLKNARKTAIAVPPKAEQVAIAASLNGLDERINAEVAVSAKAQELKASLMEVLLTGEVRVTPDEEAA